MKKDYYETLNVSRDSSESEIKKSYRKLAQTYHPDKNPNNQAAEETFKEINEAYEVLMNSDKRAAYDRFGHAGISGNRQGNPFNPFEGSPFGGMPFDPFSHFFYGMRGGPSSQNTRQMHGENLQCGVNITLEEVFNGCEKEIHYNKHVRCGHCSGSGAQKGSTPQQCTTCHGRGTFSIAHGPFHVTQTCPACGGVGVFIQTPCSNCQGEGRIQTSHILRIKIPIGIETNTQLRVQGGGSVGKRNGVTGDLFCHVNVLPHNLFERDNLNLKCNIDVPFVTAALGGDIELDGLDGKCTITIPPGTHSETVLTVSEKGLRAASSRGEIQARVRIVVPEKLTENQKSALREFAKS